MTAISEVTCPSCFEVFSVPVPARAETPSEVDYDCEVCCRPMVVSFYYDEEMAEVMGEARGLDD